MNEGEEVCYTTEALVNKTIIAGLTVGVNLVDTPLIQPVDVPSVLVEVRQRFPMIECLDAALTQPDMLFQTVIHPSRGYQVCEYGWAHQFVQPVIAWKAHLWSTSLEDWARVCRVVLPYLNHYQIYHKTISRPDLFAQLNGSVQEGKAFTLYARSPEHLKQVLVDIDHLLLMSGLILNVPHHIFGDRPIGRSHRLFYRYDQDELGNYRLNDGYYKPESVGDPFEWFHVETELVRMGVGDILVVGRDAFGYELWPAEVSRLHAEFRQTQAGLLVRDLETKNGTLVNGLRITNSTRIFPGDEVGLGSPVTLTVLNNFVVRQCFGPAAPEPGGV